MYDSEAVKKIYKAKSYEQAEKTKNDIKTKHLKGSKKTPRQHELCYTWQRPGTKRDGGI